MFNYCLKKLKIIDSKDNNYIFVTMNFKFLD
jgi:hypothetical protein